MNNTFSAKRFGTYFLHDLRRLWANAGLSLLILGLIPVIVWFVTGVYTVLTVKEWMLPPVEARAICVSLAAFVTVLIIPARTYGFITDKRAGSEWLMIPASRLEKFVSMILVTIVVVPAVFTGLSFISDWLLSLTSDKYGMALASFNLNDAIDVSSDELHIAGNGFWFVYMGVSVSLLTMLLGALFFKKQKVAKTILALLGISFVFSVIGIPVIVNDLVDFESLFDSLGKVLEARPDRMEFWLNFFIDMSYALQVGILGVLIWFRLKAIKH